MSLLSLQPYMWGVALAYTAIAYCYFCIAFGGYWAFGNGVASNVMLSVGRPSWLVGVANLLVVIHVFGSYQVSSSSDCFANMSDCQLLSCGCSVVWAKGLDEALIQNPSNRMFLLVAYPCFSWPDMLCYDNPHVQHSQHHATLPM